MNKNPFLLIFFTTLFLSWTTAPAQERGVRGQKASPWEASNWIQLPKGKKELNPADFKGKVVYLYCFQSWCPGCHSSGFPTLKNVSDHYEGDDKVAFVAIQTVFEGFSANPPSKVSEMAKRYGFSFPMGHSGSKGKRSVLMRNYRTGGTPWTIIIDQEGLVRYNDYHIKPEQAVKLIDSLK